MKLTYSAYSNISFRGEVDTGITLEDWAAMSEADRNFELTAHLFALVDIEPNNTEI